MYVPHMVKTFLLSIYLHYAVRLALSDLDDFDLGEISQGLQICGAAQLVEAVAHDANRLIFAHGPRTPQVGKASDQLGHLPHACTIKRWAWSRCSHFRRTEAPSRRVSTSKATCVSVQKLGLCTESLKNRWPIREKNQIR